MNFRRLLLPIDLCMIVFALTGIVGMVISYDRSLSFPFGMTILLSVILYFLTAYFVRGWESATRVGMLLVVAGVLVSALFITQYGYQNYPEMPGIISRLGRVTTLLPNFNIFVHPNSAAMFVEALIPLALTFAVTARARNRRILWVICSFIMLYAVMLSFSRGAWIGLAVALALAIAIYSRAGAIAIGVLIVLAVATIILGSDRLGFLDSALAWTQSRYDLYRGSLYVISDYALTGVGLGDVFALIYSRYGLLIQVPFLTYTHNLPLAVWFGQGLLGLIAFLGIVVLLVLFVRYVIGWGQPRRLFHGLWLGIVITLVHGLFDARQYTEPYWIMPVLFIMIGLTASLGRTALEDAALVSRQIRGNFVPLALPIGAVIILAAGAILLFPKLRAAWTTNRGALEETRSELAPNLNDTQRADLIANARWRYATALTYDANWSPANRRLGNLEVKLAQFADAVPLLETAYAQESSNIAAKKGLGLAYTWLGRIDDAVSLFEQLPDVTSMSQELESWGNWRNSRSEYDLAAYSYEAAADLVPGTPSPIIWLVIGQNYQQAGMPEKAQQWYERVLEAEPNNETARAALDSITQP